MFWQPEYSLEPLVLFEMHQVVSPLFLTKKFASQPLTRKLLKINTVKNDSEKELYLQLRSFQDTSLKSF